MKVVYIAGPFRGESYWTQENNIRRAENLALNVWKIGNVAVICPHTNTRFFQGATPDYIWLDGDLELLKRCDACLMTSDWEKSEGAIAEHSFCKENKIKIFYKLANLKKWLKKS